MALQIDGKVNTVVVDSCKKTTVIFDDAISSCQFVNCQSVQMQVTSVIVYGRWTFKRVGNILRMAMFY